MRLSCCRFAPPTALSKAIELWDINFRVALVASTVFCAI